MAGGMQDDVGIAQPRGLVVGKDQGIPLSTPGVVQCRCFRCADDPVGARAVIGMRVRHEHRARCPPRIEVQAGSRHEQPVWGDL